MRLSKKYKTVRCFLCLTVLLLSKDCLPQGYNSTFLLGYNAKARMSFTDTSYFIIPETRTISFDNAQANISDENGNILMSSNGVFIADATGNTMSNGGGLNPSQAVNDFPSGLPFPYADIILPMPDDSTKYVLFHQTFDFNSGYSPQVFYSIADFSFSNFGIVLSKNNIAASGLFSTGLAACRHANGRDWWIVCLSKFATEIHTFLLTPNLISYMGSQNFPLISFSPYGFSGQPSFSPDGEKFAFAGSYGINGTNYLSCVSLFDFDRCSGIFSLDTVIDFSDNYISFATAFSPNSKYLYFASVKYIYQYDTDSFGLIPHQLVAINDSFPSPSPPFYTDFFMMYLAANGKIYVSSGSSVKHLHEMNYPDSSGVACGVQLHNVYTGVFFVGVPNHPNYYLGCDTTQTTCPCLITGINEIKQHDFRFSISPNPNNGNFKIVYLLPQNKSGILQIFDITGKQIYKQNLPQWSTLQYISLPKIANGVYQCVISGGNERVHKKLVVFKE